MTIRDFAKLCGVSPSTASRFFSGQGCMSEEIREKIAKVAQQTGYAPPASYRVRRKTRATVVAILPRFTQLFFTDALEELRLQIEQIDKRLIVLPTDEKNPQNTLSALSAQDPMGVILLGENQSDPVVEALGHKNLPVVVCGALALGRQFSSVHIDDMMAAYDGMNYLISLGHRNIGVLADSNRSISSSFQRITGCRKAMEDADRSLPDNQIVHCGTTFEDGYSGMRQLLHNVPHLTAVFAFSDDSAAGAIARLQDDGRQVPSDCSVLGFDDSSVARRVRPGLSTVHQPIASIVEKSLERLLEMQGANDIASITLPYRLVERKSCRSVSAS